MTRLKERLKDKLSEDNNTSYEYISLRVSNKIASMLNIMSIIMETPTTLLLTDDITEELIEELLSDSKNIELIENLYSQNNSIISSGCLYKLIEEQIAQVKETKITPAFRAK